MSQGDVHRAGFRAMRTRSGDSRMGLVDPDKLATAGAEELDEHASKYLKART